ncbi:transcriptional regulator GlxA family with amidase domain [Frondihabitans australicus]|uniref:Transcriptional regulator GlxA family with amidase domain n=2 Tax=Frondihabitans australicus TaxID=386892 RepID=A0A495II59_9MICO|nr:transcriptional regulator GlxA family with amidase domain [Frondihabitans australicus]
MQRTHEIGFLVFQDVKMLDVAGPSEVFAEANLFGARYRISILTAGGGDVRATTGLRVPADASAFDERRWDTVLVAGGDPYPAKPVSEELIDATRHLAARADRVASICTGAFVLGAAGLLDGKRATTHWRHASELAARHPAAHVEPDRIFVHDQGVYTSAGVSAGIDLALSLVEVDHGADLARSVARSLVVYMQRGGGQSQFSAALEAPEPSTPALQAVIDRVRSDPSADYSLDSLARIALVSPRHLSRLFHDEYGSTPARYVESIRVELAKGRLDAGHSVTMAAELSGFGTPEALRRAFVRQLKTSPQRYQRRFLSTQPGGASMS